MAAMDEANATVGELHEGEWIYLSMPFEHLNGSATTMADGIVTTLHAHGWPALIGTSVDAERSTAARFEALRTADACVLDVSTPSADIGAEVAMAIGAGRPVIALEDAALPPSRLVADLIAHDPRARTIVYHDVDDCLVALAETLGDLTWITTIGDAA
jgi:hypothetical protein